MGIEDTIKQEKFRNVTGFHARFTDIDGIGPKTANKIKSIFGVDSPKDVADYTADELASEANISKKRARKAIKGGGGNPSFDERSRTGTTAAGNLADQLDSRRERATELVEQRRGVFEELVEAGEDVPERRQRRRDPDANPFFDRDPDEVRQVGQAADIFSEATSDPVDPTAESPDLGFDEQDREFAAQVRLAAQEALEQQQDVDFDEASSQTSANTEDPPEFSTVESVLSIGGMMTVGEFEVSDSEYEEAQEEFAQQSPEARRVDKRRRAPITTNEDVYARAPGRYDFPGVDTPTDDPQVKQKDSQTVDAEDTTLDTREASLFTRENKHSGGVMPTLKGLFATDRRASSGTSRAAGELVEEQLGMDTSEESTTDALADVTFLERDKEGFGEELIPFAAEESDKTRWDF